MAEAAPVEREKKRVPKERGIEDYKRKIWKLKKELEEHRDASLKVQQDELDKQKQAMLAERDTAIEQLKSETRNDLLQMRTAFSEKEAQLSRLIKQREEENKILKQQISGHSGEVTEVKDAIESAHQETVSKLQRENKQLKHINQELQQKYQVKQQDYRDKVTELKACQEEFESERQKLLNDALTVKLTKIKREQDSTGTGAKERDLQQRVTELTVALKRLEKRSDALKEENSVLKKNEASNKELEEQCAKLKRRNAELANNVKSAGEKNKQLQVTNKKAAESADASSSLEHAKKLFARQRAKDFAEHAKVVLNKDKEIEKLTKKALVLSDSISNRTRAVSMQSHLDMSTALRQSTKEKMILEMRSSGSCGDDSESKAALFNMQADYDSLHDKHSAILDEKKKLEKEFEGFRSRLGEVEQELGEERKKKITLTEECATKDKKCVQLTATNNSVTKERDHLSDTVDKLTEEISVLKHENKSCQRSIERLTNRNQELNKSLEIRDNEQRQHLESNIETLTDQLQSTKKHLKERSNEVEQIREENSVLSHRVTEILDVKQRLKSELTEVNKSTIPALQEERDDLKKMVKQLELKIEDLGEEKEELITQCNNQEDVTSALHTAELNALSLTEELNEAKENMEKEMKVTLQQKAQLQQEVDKLHSELQQTVEEKKELELNRMEAQRRIEILKTDTKQILTGKDEEIEVLVKSKTDLENLLSQKNVNLADLKKRLDEAEEQVRALQADLSRELSTHDNELQSFIQLQDKLETTSNCLSQAETCKNQLEIKLAELEKTSQAQSRELNELERAKKSIEHELRELEKSHQEQTEKLNEVSSMLEEKQAELSVRDSTVDETEKSLVTLNAEMSTVVGERDTLKQLLVQRENEKNSLATQISQLMHDVNSLQTSHLEYSHAADTKQSQYEVAVAECEELRLKLSKLEDSLNRSKNALSESKKLETLAKKKLVTLKQDLTTSYEEKLSRLNESREQLEQSNKELKLQLSTTQFDIEEHSMKQISVYAADNCYHLYIAKFAYDPNFLDESIDSPLSSPTKSADRSGADSALSATERIADIAVNPGDYVFVSGEMSEEGFYEAQLLDGRAGLIPSNVLEPLYEFDINGFVVGSVPEDELDESGKEMSEFSSTMFNDSSLLPSTPRPLAPYPRSLTLDRQLANGILVGWDCPEGNETVFVYHVYVDGKVRATLNGKSKRKALIEGVKSTVSHRVFVTATTSRGESDKCHCTIVIGEPHRPPSELRAVAKDSETAHITFLPQNSNHHHLVYINEEKVRSLGPALFQVDVAGLVPQTTYTITVIACESLEHSTCSKSNNKKSLSTSIQFTMPSVEEITAANGGHLESSFLQKFDKFLHEVTNGSPTPPAKYIHDMEPELENAEFLRSYDTGLSANISSNGHGHSSPPSQMISHSTPKFLNKIVSERGNIEDNISPIILDLDGHAGIMETSSKSTQPITHEMSNSESTVTLGASEVTPKVNSNNIGDSKNRSNGKSSEQSPDDGTRYNDSKSQNKSRASPLHNKQSLQKMIKSLTSKAKQKDKSRVSSDKGNRDDIDSTPSRNVRQKDRHGERNRQQQQQKTDSTKTTNSQPTSIKMVTVQSRQGIESVVRVRPFKALYDYEPAVMSPNKNAVHEELAFSADDVINIYGEADADGFYFGEIDNRQGYVPSNLVTELQLDNGGLKVGEKRMKALYDYDPVQLSPNPDSEQELSFRKGNVLIVTGEMDEDGFYQGYVLEEPQTTGLVPSNFLQPIT